MLNRQKRLGTAGAAIVLAGATALLLRHRHQSVGHVAPADDATTPEATKDRWQGFEAGKDVPHAPPEAHLVHPDPTSKDVTPDQVESVMTRWRQAIVEKQAETVLELDQAFAVLPGRYGPPLVKTAETDPDDRVRAFSTRVLGKMKNLELVGDFQRLLADKSPFVRQNAAWALGELAHRPGGKAAAAAAFDELRQVEDTDPATEVRTAATNALKGLQ